MEESSMFSKKPKKFVSEMLTVSIPGTGTADVVW
jgi:hypothetical protein